MTRSHPLLVSQPMLLLLALCCIPAPAQADALGPPTACPKGARSQVDHAGARCVPTACSSAAECGEGFTCESAPLCLRQETHRVYRSFPPREGDVGEERTRTIAVAPCPDGACPGALACERATRCVPAGPAEQGVAADPRATPEPGATPPPSAAGQDQAATTSAPTAESPSASPASRPVAARSSGGCALGAPASRSAALAAWIALACLAVHLRRRRPCA